MKKDRAVGIVLYDKSILLMFRKNTKEYYTFPGGGVETNESITNAVIREILEEASIVVKIDKLLFRLRALEGELHHFYLCQYVSGKPKLQKGTNEYNDTINGIDYHEPRWLSLDKIPKTTLYPGVAKLILIEYINNQKIDPNMIYEHGLIED